MLKAAPDLSDALVTQILRTRQADPLTVRGLSRYFSSGGRRFSIVANVRWSDRRRGGCRSRLPAARCRSPGCELVHRHSHHLTHLFGDFGRDIAEIAAILDDDRPMMTISSLVYTSACPSRRSI